MKCDEKELAPEKLLQPESPLVIVCEGFQDSGFVCALLRHLKIDNCDVMFPKKRKGGGNGKSAIPSMVKLVSAFPEVKGLALLWDADASDSQAFKDACESLESPFKPPKKPFSVQTHNGLSTGVFLIPGRGQKGTLEHMLLRAVYAKHPDLQTCVGSFCGCYPRGAAWDENKKAKRDMHCVVATFCEDDPGCSLGFIWQKKKDNPIDIGSSAFSELAAFLKDFSQGIEAMAVALPL